MQYKHIKNTNTMKKLIFTLLISLFALNVVAQEENTSPRYEVSSSIEIDYVCYRVKLDTQTGKMWLLVYDGDRNYNFTLREQYTINTQILPTKNDQSKPGRYTFCPGNMGEVSCRTILDQVTGNVYYLYKGSSYNTWKLVPF